MKRLFIVLFGICLCVQMQAQPTKRRTQTANRQESSTAASTAVDRASLMFPTATPMPDEVVWRRDIYRTLDLKLDANAPLYYPVEPNGRQMNLFTYIFRLLLTGRINAYEYRLDGNESFEPSAKINVKDLLERYNIFYEEKDGKLTVNTSDIPSAEVTRYYLKESVYLNQQTATFHSEVTALCPVLMREDDIDGPRPYPLFWLNFKEIATYLSRLSLMGSNRNNAAMVSANDYFAMNSYEGKIYKTNNLQGRVLAAYCPTDSAMAREQKAIEEELKTFERSVWDATPEAPADTTATADSLAVTTKKARAESKRTSRTTSRSSRTKESASEPKTKSAPKATAPRVSVRRQRR